MAVKDFVYLGSNQSTNASQRGEWDPKKNSSSKYNVILTCFPSWDLLENMGAFKVIF
jgi:hypothetical protein